MSVRCTQGCDQEWVYKGTPSSQRRESRRGTPNTQHTTVNTGKSHQQKQNTLHLHTQVSNTQQKTHAGQTQQEELPLNMCSGKNRSNSKCKLGGTQTNTTQRTYTVLFTQTHNTHTTQTASQDHPSAHSSSTCLRRLLLLPANTAAVAAAVAAACRRLLLLVDTAAGVVVVLAAACWGFVQCRC